MDTIHKTTLFDVIEDRTHTCDYGLLSRLANLPATLVTNPIANYTEFKGAKAENAALQSMIPQLNNQELYYWTSDRKAEVEFVVQWNENIITVEVKAERNISANSLSEYTKKYNPEYRVRFLMLNLQYNRGLLSSPAPLAGWLQHLMNIVKRSEST